MFPRVLGRIVGRLASATCEGFHQINQIARGVFSESAFQRGVIDAALFLIAPAAAQPLIAAYRVWSLFNGNTLTENRGGNANEAGSLPMKDSLACYFNAMAESDPLLISPVGTMPFERCLRNRD